MFELETRPAEDGFWVYLEYPADAQATFDYVAVGGAGRQTSGAIDGTQCPPGCWTYFATGFPVLRVGFTDARIAVGGARGTRPLDPPARAVEASGESLRTAASVYNPY